MPKRTTREAAADRDPARGAEAALHVLVIHGANLNLLGEREPEIYGRTRLADIDRALIDLGRELGIVTETFQSNSESAIVERIHEARNQRIDVILINPGSYTHTSVAIRDALLAIKIPVVEIHMSNVYRREPFRHHSTLADIAAGRVMGFGVESYLLALRAVRGVLKAARSERR